MPLLFLAAPLHAELLATFHTTQGDVVVELQYDKTPQTVANFITLAQGTRTRVDPLTGAVIRKPLYVGEKFFRVLDELNGDPDFNIAQTGSGTGTNSGGPGYTFRDEFDPSLTHVPYVLSMANTGSRHDNGSQIFFTGNAPIPGLNNKHTVFGLVTDSASQSVIDAIILAGDNATTINNITFERTDTAQAFDEHAQMLPICSGIAGKLDVVPGVSVAYELTNPQPAGSIFQVFRSMNLQYWQKRNEIYQAAGQVGPDQILIDDGSFSKSFYNISLVAYPDALAPAIDLLVNRVLVLNLNETDTLTFQFDDEGLGGTLVYSVNPTPETFSLVTYMPEPHKALWIMNASSFGGLKFDCLLDSETENQILGRNSAFQWNGILWNPVGSGTLTLSKP